MTGVTLWWASIRERRARKKRAVDVRWLSQLCEYHLEEHNGRGYKEEITAHLRFIQKNIDVYRQEFPDIDQHIHLSRCVLKAPSVG